LGDCEGAVTMLRELLATSSDSVLTEEGAFLLGRCYQTMGNVEQASHAFQRLVSSADPARRKEALYQYGRSLRLGGRYEEALRFLEQTGDPRSRGERAASLAGAGRLDESVPLADSLIAAGDTTAPWDSLLSLVGRHDAAKASALTDRLIASFQVPPARRAELLFADGARLVSTDRTRGIERVNQARELSQEGPVGAYARMLLLQLRLAQLETSDTLRVIRTDLDDLIQSSGPTGIQMGRYIRASTFILEVTDSVSAQAAGSDLRLFLAAEVARDSLASPRLAANLFRGMAEQFPDSPYAPKALLALSAIDSSATLTVDTLLAGRYAMSPYVLATRGESPAEFTALEDSLLKFANVMRRAARPATPTRTTQPGSPGGRLPQN
jgi:tetratricopeptide (TPR) repeat protein